jgi:hypothetical protein
MCTKMYACYSHKNIMCLKMCCFLLQYFLFYITVRDDSLGRPKWKPSEDSGVLGCYTLLLGKLLIFHCLHLQGLAVFFICTDSLTLKMKAVWNVKVLLSQQQGVASQKPSIFSSTPVRTSNLTFHDHTHIDNSKKGQSWPYLEATRQKQHYFMIMITNYADDADILLCSFTSL